MDACPLLITSIVAVKPEDQGTFFQDFLGLSGYLCSIGGFYSSTALLRTGNAQNHNEAQRSALAASGRDWIRLGSSEKLKARNRLEKRAESHLSVARRVRRRFWILDRYSMRILTSFAFLCFAKISVCNKPSKSPIVSSSTYQSVSSK